MKRGCKLPDNDPHDDIIRGVRVNLASLLELQHECRPGACTLNHCCCSTYEVCITDRELQTLTGWLPYAAKFCPHIKAKDGYDNIFEELGGRLHAIDTTDDGRCLLAYVHNGSLRCSLHSAAEKTGIPPHNVKPRSCILWPLTLSSGRPPRLSVDPNAYTFACCTRRKGLGAGVSPAIIQTVRAVFGADFMRDLEVAAARHGAPTRETP
jgi:hypothetical protein